MSVNRVLKKRREAQHTIETQDSSETASLNHTQSQQAPHHSQYDPEREKQFEHYSDYVQYNPPSF